MEKKKKFIKAILPIVALPFVALLFYVAGGGSGKQPKVDQPGNALNTTIPSPANTEETLDKLSLYKKADRDSALEQENNDLFGMFSRQTDTAVTQPLAEGAVESPFSTTTVGAAGQPRPNPEAQLSNIDRKLANLQRIMDEQPSEPVPNPVNPNEDPGASREIRQLEEMMQSIQTQPGPDGELKSMSGMLDKILDIQHPERVKERVKQASAAQPGRAYPIEDKNPAVTPDFFGPKPTRKSRRSPFYDNSPVDTSMISDNTAIPAVVHQEQTLVSGSFVEIRTSKSFYVAGKLIAAGSLLFGPCSLSGERLSIQISGIRSGDELFPVALTVYDLDGNAGIRVPGSISRDASKQSTDDAIQAVALSSMDPSLAAQAASAGIETAKSLLSRKVRLIKVTVKSDYPVLLKSENN